MMSPANPLTIIETSCAVMIEAPSAGTERSDTNAKNTWSRNTKTPTDKISVMPPTDIAAVRRTEFKRFLVAPAVGVGQEWQDAERHAHDQELRHLRRGRPRPWPRVARRPNWPRGGLRIQAVTMRKLRSASRKARHAVRSCRSAYARRMRRPLVLTGGPAAGKTTCARALAELAPKAAFIDVDDIRQLVVSGAAAPWDGPAGPEQMRLRVTNACGLARTFLDAGFDTTIADVLTPDTASIYRESLPHCMIVHLRISPAEARLRAATRLVYLTDDEFTRLHERDAENPPCADVVLEVNGWSEPEQIRVLDDLWSSTTTPT